MAKRYLSLLESKKIEYIVIYKDQKPIANSYGGRLLKWNDFLIVWNFPT